jgi:succinoglycan biosynthesis transport protein ExoP
MNTFLAVAVGGMLALGIVFLVEYLDDTVKSPEQVERTLDLPVLGTIAKIENNDAESGVHVAEAPRSPIAEAFRTLRTNIQFAAVDQPITTLLITSAGQKEGKSTLTSNLGAVMAHGGRKITILEADLRRPRVHKLLDLKRSPGLSDLFVQDKLSLDSALQDTAVPDLQAVASGDLPPNPAELLGSERMSQILEAMKEDADLVLIDSSPAAVVTDSVVLSEKVDAVLLVIEPGKTELPSAEYAVEALRRAGANIIGVVFNNVPLKRSGYYGSYKYQYTYSYESDEETEGH